MIYGKLVNGVLVYPPATMRRGDGTTIVGYDHNVPALEADGWMPVEMAPAPDSPARSVVAIVDGVIRVTWELLPVPEPAPVLMPNGIEVPVLVLQSQTLNKGIGLVATDDGDIATYIDHESPRPDDATIKARIAAAIEAKRTVKQAAKQASRHGNLQARIEALERLLGVAE